MFICKNCGQLIEKLPTYEDHIGDYGDEAMYETVEDDNCVCGGYYEKAAICIRCEENKPADDFEYSMCKDCQMVVMDKLKKILKDNFKANEISFIFENWGEE